MSPRGRRIPGPTPPDQQFAYPVKKVVAPARSWWLVPDAEFSAAAQAERPRMGGTVMATFVENTHSAPWRPADPPIRRRRPDVE